MTEKKYYITNRDILKSFLKNIFIKKEIWIGGVINYYNHNSNIIKFATQSIFSHVNFYDPELKVGLGAEDLKSILIVDYNNYDGNEFYYVTKKFNIKYISKVFGFNYINDVFYSLGKFSEEDIKNERLLTRFYQYSFLTLKYSKEELFELIRNNNFEYDSSEFQKDIKLLDNKSLISEFILLGMIKHIYNNFSKKYDLGSTISICLTPWFQSGFDENKYFCSEFVSENFLYAGIYPFDIKSKDPKSVSPGDILDLSLLYCSEHVNLHIISKDGIKKLPVDKKGPNSIVKNYLFSKDIEKGKQNNQIKGAHKIRELIFFLTDSVNKNNLKYFKYVFLFIVFSIVGISVFVTDGMGNVMVGDLANQDMTYMSMNFFRNFLYVFFIFFFILLLLGMSFIFYIINRYLKFKY